MLALVAFSMAYLTSATLAAEPKPQLEAYADTTSVAPGGSITLFARPMEPISATYRVRFFRVPASPQLHAAQAIKPIAIESMKVADAPSCDFHGCNWNGTAFLISKTWRTGLYMARIGEDCDGTDVYFVVRRDPARSRAKILVQIPFTTVQAYNSWGGKSFYTSPAADYVSFQRPTPFESAVDGGHGHLRDLIDWLDTRFPSEVDYISSIDLASGDYALFSSTGPVYAALIIPGHDEYWSDKMLANIIAFGAAGGNVAFLGGNICDGRVSFPADAPHAPPPSEGGRDAEYDVMYYKPGDRWRNYSSMNTLLLLGMQTQESHTTRTYYCESYALTTSNSWALRGVKHPEVFGRLLDGTNIVGYEVDDRRYPDVPGNFVFLGKAPYNSYITTGFGFFCRDSSSDCGEVKTVARGVVFAVGTIDWSRGLARSERGSGVDVVTTNVVSRLSGVVPQGLAVSQ
jgi:hypothetical protein